MKTSTNTITNIKINPDSPFAVLSNLKLKNKFFMNDYQRIDQWLCMCEFLKLGYYHQNLLCQEI